MEDKKVFFETLKSHMTDFKVRVQFDGQFFFQTNYPKITKIPP